MSILPLGPPIKWRIWQHLFLIFKASRNRSLRPHHVPKGLLESRTGSQRPCVVIASSPTQLELECFPFHWRILVATDNSARDRDLVECWGCWCIQRDAIPGVLRGLYGYVRVQKSCKANILFRESTEYTDHVNPEHLQVILLCSPCAKSTSRTKNTALYVFRTPSKKSIQMVPDVLQIETFQPSEARKNIRAIRRRGLSFFPYEISMVLDFPRQSSIRCSPQ